MTQGLKNQTETKYVICHNGIDVYHYSIAEVGQEIISGQPYIVVFDNKDDAINFLPEKFRIDICADEE